MSLPPRPTLLDVDRLRKGLLTPDEAAQVQAAIDAHGDPEANLRSDEEVFGADPPDRFLRRVHAATERPASRGWLVAPALTLAVAAAVMFAIPPTEDPQDILLKGVREPSLHLLRGGPNGGLHKLRDGDAATAGDTIQLAYEDGGAPYGVLLSVDGVGAVTEHLRWTFATAGEVYAPRAYRLDAAPSFEAFHLITSHNPIDVDALLADAARAGRDGPRPPAGGARLTITLRKVP